MALAARRLVPAAALRAGGRAGRGAVEPDVAGDAAADGADAAAAAAPRHGAQPAGHVRAGAARDRGRAAAERDPVPAAVRVPQRVLVLPLRVRGGGDRVDVRAHGLDRVAAVPGGAPVPRRVGRYRRLPLRREERRAWAVRGSRSRTTGGVRAGRDPRGSTRGCAPPSAAPPPCPRPRSAGALRGELVAHPVLEARAPRAPATGETVGKGCEPSARGGRGQEPEVDAGRDVRGAGVGEHVLDHAGGRGSRARDRRRPRRRRSRRTARTRAAGSAPSASISRARRSGRRAPAGPASARPPRRGRPSSGRSTRTSRRRRRPTRISDGAVPRDGTGRLSSSSWPSTTCGSSGRSSRSTTSRPGIAREALARAGARLHRGVGHGQVARGAPAAGGRACRRRRRSRRARNGSGRPRCPHSSRSAPRQQLAEDRMDVRARDEVARRRPTGGRS